MDLKKLIVASAFALGASFTAANAAVINGSFEDNIATPGANNGNTFADMVGESGSASWDVWASPDVPGWETLALPLGIEIQTALTIPLNPFDGDYYAELDSNDNSTIWQDIFLNAGEYTLSFAYSPRVNDGGFSNAIDVTINGLLPTQVVNGPGIDGTAVGEWTVFSFDFLVETADEYRLTFDAGGTSDSLGGFLDAVEINAVPLPAAGLMLLAGLGGLGMMRRKQKS